MRILLDENFPKSAADVIAAAAHEVISFADVCEFGADDEEVFVCAQKLGAVILTSDRDFYHTVPLIHPEHCGIIVVALRQPNRKAILTRLQWFFENFDCPMTNRVFILRDYSCRAK